MTSITRTTLALFIALTLGLLSSAIAVAQEYNAKTTPITATGKNHTFTAGEAIITCKKAEFKYTGTAGKHKTINVTPAYKECKVLEQEATVTVEKGAQFEFGIPHELKSEEFSLLSTIVGETGAKLKVLATISGESCEVSFPAQSIAGETTKFVNNLEKTGGEVKSKLENVEYKSNSKCAGFVGKEGKNGKYEGSASELGLVIE
jgi:opacity protein-like surface antigen